MDCIICNSKMSYYFTKNFEVYGLKSVDYHICNNCGFFASKTHYGMSKQEWEELNLKFHNDHNIRNNPYNRNQRYFNQGLLLHLMIKSNFFSNEEFLDWGSGAGSLSKISNHFFEINIKNYDKYFEPELNKVSELKKRNFDLVISTGVFEHVTDRETLDEIESYTLPTGALAIHTLVPERIPKDSEWMYLLPVHCSFHTNKSMGNLMKQWGYLCSVYNEHSKMWVLFKEDMLMIKLKVELMNKKLGWNYLKFKEGFVDYWK